MANVAVSLIIQPAWNEEDQLVCLDDLEPQIPADWHQCVRPSARRIGYFEIRARRHCDLLDSCYSHFQIILCERLVERIICAVEFMRS